MNKRMEWLDAMRGLTMILVVAYHVAQMSFGISEKTSSSLPFLVLFRMPLFFFVSGFLAYKGDFAWTWTNTMSLTWKKVKIQVLPALVFLCAFIILKRPEFWGSFEYAMKSPTKMGYWFTWVLLHMFIIYYAACMLQSYVNSKFPKNRYPNIVIWTLFLLSLIVYESLYLPDLTYYKEPFFRYSSLIKTMNFLPFFLFGNLTHRYWTTLQRLTATCSSWFVPMLMIVAFISCADIFRWHACKMEWANLPRTTAMYSLLVIMIVFFYHYQAWFTHERVIGRFLQYIGVRTLDVYLLHFILLPKMPQVGQWLNANRPNFVLEIVTSFSVALVVIAFCLLVSQVLRISPLFRRYLFGRH